MVGRGKKGDHHRLVMLLGHFSRVDQPDDPLLEAEGGELKLETGDHRHLLDLGPVEDPVLLVA